CPGREIDSFTPCAANHRRLDPAGKEVLSRMAVAADTDSPEALSDGLGLPRRHWAAATLLLTLTIAVLDATMSNVALPAIAQALSIAPADVVWVVIAYNLVVVVSLLPLSAVAERVGFRRMFAVGVTLFMLASICSAASVSLTTLVF